MQPDNRTVSEIVEDPDNSQEETEEPDEAALENAQTELPAGTFVPQPHSIQAAIDYAPSINQRREEAQIPPQTSIKDLLGKTFVIVDKVRQKAALPDTGEMREGWQCLCADVETQKPFTVWIGQVALMRDLSAVSLPFRTTITKRGRTYQFS